MDPLISIISPVRNEEKHIYKCLHSLVSQDFDLHDYEILVIDGISDDTTRGIVKEFETTYENITLYDNPKHTVPYALNIGLAHAKGDIIIRVDGHAVLEKDYLKRCLQYIESTEADCVGGVIESINETVQGEAIALAMSSPFGVGNARFRTSGREGFVDSLAFGAYRREVFQKIGYFDEELTRNQDDEFNYRLRKFGGKIFFTPKIKSYYYPRADLKRLWKQYYQYGFWKVRVLQKHLRMMQLRQFVPPVFVVSLLITGFLGLFFRPLLLLFGMIVVLYGIANITASIKISYNKGFKYLGKLPLIFIILHIGFGLGFLFGLIKFAKYWFVEKK